MILEVTLLHVDRSPGNDRMLIKIIFDIIGTDVLEFVEETGISNCNPS